MLLSLSAFGPTTGAHAQKVARPCPAPYALVMGAAQYNGVPSPVFKRRLDAAYFLYQRGCVAKIIVSGGKQPGDRFTEGGTGVRYLAGRGVPPKALLSEKASGSSFENLTLSRAFFGNSRILIVTDDIHAYRVGFLTRHLGIDAQVVAVKSKGASLPYLLHEAAGMGAYLLGIYR